MNRVKELVEEYKKTHRREDGTELTQKDIAELMGVDPSILSRYMRGYTSRVDFDVWQRMANFFKVDGSKVFNVTPDTDIKR